MNHKRSLVDEAKHVSRKERKKRIDVVLMNESNRERESKRIREKERESRGFHLGFENPHIIIANFYKLPNQLLIVIPNLFLNRVGAAKQALDFASMLVEIVIGLKRADYPQHLFRIWFEEPETDSRYYHNLRSSFRDSC